MTAPLTDTELAEIRALADGFRGTFAWDPAHTEDRGIGRFPDCVDIEDRLRYAPEGFDVHDDESSTISDCLDEHVAQPIAEMLNAVPRLLDLIAHQRAALVVVEAERDELRRECEQLRESVVEARGCERKRCEEITRLDGELAKARAERDEANTRIDIHVERVGEARNQRDVMRSQRNHARTEVDTARATVERITKERDEARAETGLALDSIVHMQETIDTARAELSRLKAGLVEMRAVVAGPHEIEWHHTANMIDALLEEST